MKIEELISKLEQELARLNEILKVKDLNGFPDRFTSGLKHASSRILKEIKNLDVATVERSELIEFREFILDNYSWDIPDWQIDEFIEKKNSINAAKRN